MDNFKGLKFMRLDKRIADVGGADMLYDVNKRQSYQRSKTNFHVEYVNLTDKSMYVKNRMGLIEVIEPELYLTHNGLYTTNDIAKRGIIVNIEMLMTYNSATASMDSIKPHVNKSPLSAALYEKIKLARSRLGGMRTTSLNNDKSTTVNLCFFIHQSTIEGNSRYFSELDVTLSLHERGEDVFEVEHPNTQDKLVGGRGGEVDYWHEGNEQSDKGLNINLSLIDQSGAKTISDRYVNVLGKVYKVPIIYKTPVGNKRSVGFAVRRNYSSLNPCGERIQEFEQLDYTIEEAEKEFGLSTTVEEAFEFANPTSKAEREKERLEIESYRRKMELNAAQDELFKSKQQFEETKSKIEANQFGMKSIVEKYRLDTAIVKCKADHFETTTRGLLTWMSAVGMAYAVGAVIYGKLSKGSNQTLGEALALPKGI